MLNQRQKFGKDSESVAVRHLKKNGYKILEQNYRNQLGEIDIIATQHDVIHFVEVKSGTTFEPIYNITPSKLSKIIKTANIYLKSHKLSQAFCIDACIVKGKDVEHLENLTL